MDQYPRRSSVPPTDRWAAENKRLINTDDQMTFVVLYRDGMTSSALLLQYYMLYRTCQNQVQHGPVSFS